LNSNPPDRHENSATPGATATYALVGWPLGFSLSPAMHNAAFAALGIPATYILRPTPPADLAVAIDALREGSLAGANITVPHKVAVRHLLDDESDLATGIGAVNTVVRGPHGLRGENTDPAGFRQALEAVDRLDGRGRRALVLGAGGAARAVVHTLIRAGYAVKILSRSSSQSGVLAAQLYRAHPGAPLATGLLTPAGIVADAATAEILVNATPVGSAAPANGTAGAPGAPGTFRPDSHLPDTRWSDSLWPASTPIPGHLTVIDLVAWPPTTALVAHAHASGAQAIGGFEMLLGQAAHAFTLWTGQPAPIEVMRAAGLHAIAENSPSPSLIGGGGRGEGGLGPPTPLYGAVPPVGDSAAGQPSCSPRPSSEGSSGATARPCWM
jgi:shikimate dehydrogenase